MMKVGKRKNKQFKEKERGEIIMFTLENPREATKNMAGSERFL